MVNHAKIIELLHKSREQLLQHENNSFELLVPIIQDMAADNNFMDFINSSHDVPICIEKTPFNYAKDVFFYKEPYTALGVDGSQVYPDRHSGISCFLLHIGSILIEYGSSHGFVSRESQPFLFSEWNTWNDVVPTNDIVDTERFLHELSVGFEQAYNYKQRIPERNIIVFIDGPLLFWHGAQKPVQFQREYGSRYVSNLQLFEYAQIPIVGYTSMSRSRELVKIVKKYLEYAKINDKRIVDLCVRLTDTQIIALFLAQNQRTALFQSSVMTQDTNYNINFFYINTGAEYIRVEMPSWIEKNEKATNFSYAAIMHQIENGFGYPTVLALAHEQAVIKNNDRIFFTKMLHKTLFDQHFSQKNSQKQIKKNAGNLSKKPFIE